MIELLAPCLLKVADAAPLLAPFPDKVFVGSGSENYGDLLAPGVSRRPPPVPLQLPGLRDRPHRPRTLPAGAAT